MSHLLPDGGITAWTTPESCECLDHGWVWDVDQCIQRCDQCQKFDSDEDAEEAFLVWLSRASRVVPP